MKPDLLAGSQLSPAEDLSQSPLTQKINNLLPLSTWSNVQISNPAADTAGSPQISKVHLLLKSWAKILWQTETSLQTAVLQGSANLFGS